MHAGTKWSLTVHTWICHLGAKWCMWTFLDALGLGVLQSVRSIPCALSLCALRGATEDNTRLASPEFVPRFATYQLHRSWQDTEQFWASAFSSRIWLLITFLPGLFYVRKKFVSSLRNYYFKPQKATPRSCPGNWWQVLPTGLSNSKLGWKELQALSSHRPRNAIETK